MAENQNKWSGENPWLGLVSYTEGQRLYGRDKEIVELTDIILNHNTVVVYGKSGIGKSSLLRAGVFPELRKQDFVPIYVRLEHNTDVSYTQQIESAIKEHISLEDLLPTDIPDLGLWDFVHRHHFNDATGHAVTPVIVLDQFEEIFTLTQKEHKSDVQHFFSQLADLFNDVKPDAVIKAESDYRKKHAAASTENSNKSGGLLIGSIGRFNYERTPLFRLVFSIRDDSLYLLERKSDKIPPLKTNRFNLNALDEENALQVIMSPRPGLFTQEEGHKILDELAYYEYDDFRVVDPAILSLFLYSYYKEQGRASSRAIFHHYYLDSISGINRKQITTIEKSLLTEQGSRIQIPIEDLLSSGVTVDSLNRLQQNNIIRKERRKGVDFVEFTHDRLCEHAINHRDESRNKKVACSCLLLGLVPFLLVGIFILKPFLQKEGIVLEDQISENRKWNIFLLEDSLHNLRDSLAGIPQRKDYWYYDSLEWSNEEYEDYYKSLEDSIQVLRDSIYYQPYQYPR